MSGLLLQLSGVQRKLDRALQDVIDQRPLGGSDLGRGRDDASAVEAASGSGMTKATAAPSSGTADLRAMQAGGHGQRLRRLPTDVTARHGQHDIGSPSCAGSMSPSADPTSSRPYVARVPMAPMACPPA